MANDIVLVGWNRSIPGREQAAVEVFSRAVSFWQSQQKSGNIAGFDVVMLTAHGGDLNGFFLLRGERAKLDRIKDSEEFKEIVTHAIVNLDGIGVIDGWTGEAIQQRMSSFVKALPKK